MIVKEKQAGVEPCRGDEETTKQKRGRWWESGKTERMIKERQL